MKCDSFHTDTLSPSNLIYDSVKFADAAHFSAEAEQKIKAYRHGFRFYYVFICIVLGGGRESESDVPRCVRVFMALNSRDNLRVCIVFLVLIRSLDATNLIASMFLSIKEIYGC